DVERRDHRAGRDLEGLEQEGAQHQYGEQDREEGLRVFDRHRLAQQRQTLRKALVTDWVGKLGGCRFAILVQPLVPGAELGFINAVLSQPGLQAGMARSLQQQSVEQPDEAGYGREDQQYQRKVYIHVASVSSGAAPMWMIGAPGLLVHLQNGQESLLRHFHGAHLLHALLACLLFLEQFALAAYVTAITLGRHVLAQRLDGGARNDLPADGGLDGHV